MPDDSALIAHYQRVWAAMTDAAEGLPAGRADRTKAVVISFVVHAVLDRRPLANIITQWEIDADSVVDQSLAEMRGFKRCLPGYLDALHSDAPAKVREAYRAMAEYFAQLADHAEARSGIAMLWLEVIPQLRDGLGGCHG